MQIWTSLKKHVLLEIFYTFRLASRSDCPILVKGEKISTAAEIEIQYED